MGNKKSLRSQLTTAKEAVGELRTYPERLATSEAVISVLGKLLNTRRHRIASAIGRFFGGQEIKPAALEELIAQIINGKAARPEMEIYMTGMATAVNTHLSKTEREPPLALAEPRTVEGPSDEEAAPSSESERESEPPVDR